MCCIFRWNSHVVLGCAGTVTSATKVDGWHPETSFLRSVDWFVRKGKASV